MRRSFTAYLVCVVMLPLSGCFTAMSRFMHSPGIGEAIAAGTLDVATLPVQIVVLGPLMLSEYIDENTGERGRKTKEREKFNEEVAKYERRLDSDFSLAYTDEAFLSDDTETPAHKALHKWLGEYGIHRPKQQQIDAFAEKIIETPKQANAYRVVLNQKNMSPTVKGKLCKALIEYARTLQADEQRSAASYIAPYLTDDEIKALISSEEDYVDGELQECLNRRDRRREEDHQREARKKAQKEEYDRCRKAMLEARILREKQLIELSKGIDGGSEEFQQALAVRHEMVVANIWQRRFADKKAEFPPENIKNLAYAYTQSDEPLSFCCTTLFSRPELSADDVRELYGRMLYKLAKGKTQNIANCSLVGSLVKNEKCPPDVIEASYREPLLADLRRMYIIHHFHHFEGKARDNFMKNAEMLFDEFSKGKGMSYERYSEKLFKLTKPLLPRECPEDWVKCI